MQGRQDDENQHGELQDEEIGDEINLMQGREHCRCREERTEAYVAKVMSERFVAKGS